MSVYGEVGSFITLASGELRCTSPRIGTSIFDTNGNELLIFTVAGSAVNELTLSNANTGGVPGFSASGGDSEISISFTPKGTGTFRVVNPSDSANLFAVNNILPGATFPRTLFLGGKAAGDSNWLMRFANFYSDSSTNITCGFQISTNRDAGYSNAETISILAITTGHVLYAFSGSANDGQSISISTKGSDFTAVPNIFCATVGNGQRVGFLTTAPDRQVEINNATGNCLRLTYNDSNGSATNYIDLLVTSAGEFKIAPSSGYVFQTAPNAAPTDGNIPNGNIVFYLDEAGNNLKGRIKYSDGTLKTFTAALA